MAEQAFAGCRVLVTGAASGIGLATARRLAAAGAAVAGLDVDADGLAAGMQGVGPAVIADVADGRAVERAVAEAADALGGLDGLANVAGTGYLTGDVTVTSPDLWGRVLAVNLTGAYLVSRAAIGHLRAAGGGAVVHVSSQFALAGALASPAYCASKAGLLGLTRAMAVDHAGQGIRVNAVCPARWTRPSQACCVTLNCWSWSERGGSGGCCSAARARRMRWRLPSRICSQTTPRP